MKQKAIAIAYYEKEDWKRFLQVIDDRESMHETWDEWHEAAEKLKKDLILQGFKVREVKVNIDELIDYCTKRKIKNDGKARSQFVLNR